MNFNPPKGTDDIFPPASRAWRRALSIWERLAERYGYDLVIGPIFESTEVFARGVGESTEVVQKQMYTFEDKGGRSLTLRPEGTASVVRAYLGSGSQGVAKLAYAGPMFRYERPQAGRRRQFFQTGVEYVATASPDADAEVVELGYRFLEELGLDQVTVALNSIGDSVCRPAYLEVLRAYLDGQRDVLCDESLRNLETNPLRVLDCKVCAPILSDAPNAVDFLCDDCTAHFDSVRARLDSVGIPYRLEPRLVRGLDYYTRTAFEYIATGFDAAQNAVGGGGRYDGLAEALGGPAVPGVGLAMGIDRILLAAGDDGTDVVPLDLFIIVAAPERREVAARFLSELRLAGVRADMAPEQRSVKAQFRAADRRQAAGVAIVGVEWEDDRVVVRNLSKSTQDVIKREEVAAWAKGNR
ncbi:MAG: histidine--tRNA ligase [Acidimicrobiia bacterium]|nr:histidine--tRNA ligase [Acidimicrobiia bacterium]